MSELSAFEKERLANIRERDELLKKLRQEALSAGMFPVKASPLSPADRQRKPPSSRKRVKREHAELPKPTRSSARLRGLQASSAEEKRKLDEEHEAARLEEQRKRMRVSGDLKLEDIIVRGTRWNNELKHLGIGPVSDATRWARIKEEQHDEESKPTKQVSKEISEVRERFGRLK
ncbi:hypothetical protein KEM54_002656, partial [Ascosphaera aggregata]